MGSSHPPDKPPATTPEQVSATERARVADTEPSDPPEAISDSLERGPTARAPSYRAPAAGPIFGEAAALPEVGQRIDDFELTRLLGQGAFGTVFLARQQSLDRDVALKVAANRGSEGRTMARLEHPHIVQVFSESVVGGLRLLCMQLVSGAPLDAVIASLHKAPDEGAAQTGWTGADYLAAVDQHASLRGVLDAQALRDRERLAESDRVQAAAWVAARLAEALAFAHGQGVLHRDIKPANILVDRYGRPLLADFNISGRSDDAGGPLGGTIAYMAPEHLRAFDPGSPVKADAVDQRSDLYSLAMAAYELLYGRPPLSAARGDDNRNAYVRRLASLRTDDAPPIEPGPNDAEKTLCRTIARGLAAEPGDRYQTGDAMAAALDGCRALAAAQQALPRGSWLTRAAERRPFVWLVLAALTPQLVGSLVNIAYNSNSIVGSLNDPQQALFVRLAFAYNLLAYPVLLGVSALVLSRVYLPWRKLESAEPADDRAIALARARALRLPLWMLAIAAAGWLPGGVIFPLAINHFQPPLEPGVFFHFTVSFTLSGLVAVAYSFCGLQYLVLRVLYPRFWSDATGFHAKARQELRGAGWRVALVQWLAGSVPLAAALFVFDTTLGKALVLLGIAGVQFAARAARLLNETLAVLLGKSEG
ncbi:Serine/threonine-protein kinase PknH [Pirellulimonas nuda]|uniref:Serine/threonine-protein kinase PknH n=1 Tax=Pirellulimonas nuda TaxID=2528009 RepID=A0A518DID9_9BACT|nr:serine/threonine-protein kinase [Pirellulimonas nuda]QDU91244.1 Serine/threonine-protein kinase PknH [Pirellulimonas nuda]